MIVLETVIVAFSMFSAIPVPKIRWTEKNMRYAMLAFPLVGVATGLLGALAYTVLRALGIPGVFTAAVLTALPVLVTGGIHIDGYADTCDALSSHADKEKKLAILSDPHVGSFAVIKICICFITVFACFAALKEFWILPYIMGFCQSRTLSGISVASFRTARDSGLVHAFSKASDRTRVRDTLIILDIVLIAGQCLYGWGGVIITLVCHFVFMYYHFVSKKHFGGITGDLAGWFVVKAEVFMLFSAVLCQYIF